MKNKIAFMDHASDIGLAGLARLLARQAERADAKLCRFCGQPMKPKGVKKLLNEYDHAQGCVYSRKRNHPRASRERGAR